MPPYEEVFLAAEDDDDEKVRDFVENRGVPANATNEHEITLAHVASRKGNLNLVKYILEKDLSILTDKKCRGEEVFNLAIKYGHLHVVKYLVETLNQPIEKRFSNRFSGNTPIHQAVEYEYLHVLKYFLEERNGDVNILSDVQQTPVFIAVENRNLTLTKYLIEERGADVNRVDYRSDTLLDKAADRDDFDMLRYLIGERKIKAPRTWKEDQMHQVATFNRLPLMKYLVGELHAKVNV